MDSIRRKALQMTFEAMADERRSELLSAIGKPEGTDTSQATEDWVGELTPRERRLLAEEQRLMEASARFNRLVLELTERVPEIFPRQLDDEATLGRFLAYCMTSAANLAWMDRHLRGEEPEPIEGLELMCRSFEHPVARMAILKRVIESNDPLRLPDLGELLGDLSEGTAGRDSKAFWVADSSLHWRKSRKKTVGSLVKELERWQKKLDDDWAIPPDYRKTMRGLVDRAVREAEVFIQALIEENMSDGKSLVAEIYMSPRPSTALERLRDHDCWPRVAKLKLLPRGVKKARGGESLTPNLAEMLDIPFGRLQRYYPGGRYTKPLLEDLAELATALYGRWYPGGRVTEDQVMSALNSLDLRGI